MVCAPMGAFFSKIQCHLNTFYIFLIYLHVYKWCKFVIYCTISQMLLPVCLCIDPIWSLFHFSTGPLVWMGRMGGLFHSPSVLFSREEAHLSQIRLSVSYSGMCRGIQRNRSLQMSVRLNFTAHALPVHCIASMCNKTLFILCVFMFIEFHSYIYIFSCLLLVNKFHVKDTFLCFCLRNNADYYRFKFTSYEHVYSIAIGIQIQFERRIIFSSLQNIMNMSYLSCPKLIKG